MIETVWTTYCTLIAEPEALRRRVDVDSILEEVCTVLGLDPKATLEWFLSRPCTLRVKTSEEILDAIRRGQAPFAPGCIGKGVCLSLSQIWVLRLDWPGVIAHEGTHLIQRLLGHLVSESEARRVEDMIQARRILT